MKPDAEDKATLIERYTARAKLAINKSILSLSAGHDRVYVTKRKWYRSVIRRNVLKILELDPANMWARWELRWTKNESDPQDWALNLAKETLQLNPGDKRARIDYAQELISAGDQAAGEAELRACMAAWPEDAGIPMLLNLHFEEQQRWAEAEEVMRLVKNPKWPLQLFLLEALAKQKKIPEMEAVAAGVSFEEEHDYCSLYFNLVRLWARLGEYDRAIAAAKEFRRRPAASPREKLRLMSMAYLRTQRPLEALPLAEELVKLWPVDYHKKELHEVLLKAGRTESARGLLLALKDDKSFSYRQWLWEELAAIKEITEAEAVIRDYLAYDEKQHYRDQGRYALSGILRARGETKELVTLWREWYASGFALRAHISLAFALILDGQAGKGLETCDKAITRTKTEPAPSYRSEFSAQLKDDLSAAAKLPLTPAELKKLRRCYRRLGNLFLANNKPEEAKAAFAAAKKPV